MRVLISIIVYSKKKKKNISLFPFLSISYPKIVKSMNDIEDLNISKFLFYFIKSSSFFFFFWGRIIKPISCII